MYEEIVFATRRQHVHNETGNKQFTKLNGIGARGISSYVEKQSVITIPFG